MTAVDPTGRYVGGHDVVGQNFVPILWTAGVPRILPIQAESADISAVNENGVVVGLAYQGSDEYVFRYQNGTVTRLRPPAGYPHVFPEPAVNAAGDVVINAEGANAVEGAGSIAVLWKAGTSTPVTLLLPAGANVFAVTDDGIRVGTVYINGVADRADAWEPDGHSRQLEHPAGQRSVAYAARGHWAAGGVFPKAGNTGQVARWDLDSGKVTLFDAPGNALDVNALGWIVTRSAVLGATGPVPLAPLATGRQNEPAALADTGLVVGVSTDSKGQRQPVTWQC